MREHYLISEKCQAIARAAHRERISQPHSSDIMEHGVLLGGYSSEVPPLPIPNREVKLTNADGTAYLGGRVGSRLFKSGLAKDPTFLLYSITRMLHLFCLSASSYSQSGLLQLTRLKRRYSANYIDIPSPLSPPFLKGRGLYSGSSSVFS